MPIHAAPAAGNRLLASLPARDYGELLPGLEQVTLPFGTVLYESGEPIRHVHFPDSGIVSLLTAVDARTSLEVGMVGREGMVGIPALLGVDRCSTRAVVRNAGSAMRMQVAVLRKEAARNGSLRQALDRYTHALLAQLFQAAACNRFHSVEERFARWLLMTQDRLQSNEFHMTHELMSHILGVRRAGITIAARRFQSDMLIHYRRGSVAILDTAGLQNASCNCYRTIKTECEGTLGSGVARARSRAALPA